MENVKKMINLRKEITESNVKRNLDYAGVTRDAKAGEVYQLMGMTIKAQDF